MAISLANLCYLRIWDVLLHHPELGYHAVTPYNRFDYVAAIIGAGLLAAGLYFVVQLVWLGDRRWLRAIALLTILGIINMVYAVANVAFPGKESLRAQLPGKAVEPGYVAKNRVVWIGKQDARWHRFRHCRSSRLAWTGAWPCSGWLHQSSGAMAKTQPERSASTGVEPLNRHAPLRACFPEMKGLSGLSVLAFDSVISAFQIVLCLSGV